MHNNPSTYKYHSEMKRSAMNFTSIQHRQAQSLLCTIDVAGFTLILLLTTGDTKQ